MSSIEKAIERLNKSREVGAKVDRSEVTSSRDQAALEKRAVSALDKAAEKRLGSASLNAQEDSSSTESTEQNAAAVKQNSLCRLDFTELVKKGYLTPNSTNKVLSEEYRAIKRPILMNAFGKGAAPVERGNLVVVTSSLPGEGKTYTALNLALSIASELDSTVLLVDGDILKPHLSELLGLEKNKGLTDVLRDNGVDVSDVMASTQIPKLKVIPAGSKYEHSTELLASVAMERLVEELGQRYTDRIVLFDSPPLLATSEAFVLNHLMGQIMLVVEAGKTPIDAVRDSISQLDDNKVIGLVLNKTNGQSRSSSYGKYGGYG